MESFLGERQRRGNGKKEERKKENDCANPFGRLAVPDYTEADSVQGSRRAHRQKFSSFALASLYTDLYSLEPGPQTWNCYRDLLPCRTSLRDDETTSTHSLLSISSLIRTSQRCISRQICMYVFITNFNTCVFQSF